MSERHVARSLRNAGVKGRPGPKLHTCDRLRGSTLHIERWTNAKAALIGFLHGRGKSSVEIERILDDGTIAATVRSQIARRWGLPEAGKPFLPVVLTYSERKKLADQAKKMGITSEEWARRVLSCAINDSLYAAVTDGRFDK